MFPVRMMWWVKRQRSAPHCENCRYWTPPCLFRDQAIVLPRGEWRDCEIANKRGGRGIFYHGQGWSVDGGAIMTRSDFGCVRFEAK